MRAELFTSYGNRRGFHLIDEDGDNPIHTYDGIVVLSAPALDYEIVSPSAIEGSNKVILSCNGGHKVYDLDQMDEVVATFLRRCSFNIQGIAKESNRLVREMHSVTG